MKKFQVSLSILFLFSLYIHPVMIKGPALLSYAYIYGIPAFYVFLNLPKLKIITLKQIVIIGFSLILLLLSIVYPTLHSTGDYSYIRVATFIFRKIILYIFLVEVLINKYKNETTISYFMYYFATAQAAYVLGTIFLVLVPGLKELWFSIFNEVIESDHYLHAYGYTFRFGWQGFSGFGFTMYCTLGCFLLLYLYYGRKREIELNAFQFYCPFYLTLLGNMFYGRSGLVISIIGYIFGIFFWNRQHLVKVLKAFAIFATGILVVYSLRNVPIFMDWYDWMSRPLLSVLKTGSFNNASFDRTSEMIFKPELTTILFGDGMFTQDGHYYMRTDSGIMRSILFWGIFGTFIAYFTTIYSLTELKKKDVLLFILFLGAFIAFEFKGHVYYDFIALMLSFTFFDSIFASSNWNLEADLV